MTTQPSLFDAAAARDEAVERVAKHANPAWVDAAVEAIRTIAEHSPDLTAANVWAYLSGYAPSVTTHNPKAMVAPLKIAQKQGYIAPTEAYRASGRRESHNRPERVWKSLLHGKAD